MSKSKPKLIVLIIICQHIQSEVPIHLVPEILEPNKLYLKNKKNKNKNKDKFLKTKNERESY